MCMLVGLFVCCGDWGVLHRTLMPYQSLREKGSTVFFLRPFLPLDNLLFLSKVHLSADCSFSLPRCSVWAIVHCRWDRKSRRTCQQPSLRGSDLKDGQWFVRWVEVGDREIQISRRRQASNRQSEFSEELAVVRVGPQNPGERSNPFSGVPIDAKNVINAYHPDMRMICQKYVLRRYMRLSLLVPEYP